MSRCLFLTFIFLFLILSFSSFAQDSSITRKIWGNDRQAKTLFVEEQYDFRSSWLKIGKTDKERVEKLFNKNTVDGEKCTKTDFKKALKMKNSFLRDDFCREFIVGAEFQKVCIKTLELNFNGIEFELGKVYSNPFATAFKKL